MVRRRFGWWIVVVAVLAAGCAAPGSKGPAASDEADVWFMQHMAGHLLQTTSIVDLGGERITRPKLARLANTINQQEQAHLAQLQDWLANRGLAPYDPQQQPSSRKETHLQRLSRVSEAKFDLAFLTVMTARHRAGNKLAAAELRDGSVPRGPPVRPTAAGQTAGPDRHDDGLEAGLVQAEGQVTRRPKPPAIGHGTAGGNAPRLTGTAGSDCGETASTLLDKAGRFPILV
jgi:predicted outer membrane protein